MDVNTVIKKTYSQILESKLRYGFRLGLNDCFTLGVLYHRNLFNDDTILEVIKKPYSNERQLLLNIQKLGYKDIPDVFMRRGYSRAAKPQLGDIALALLPMSSSHSLMIKLKDNEWITSSNDYNHDKIRIASPRLLLIGRPPYELLL